MTGTTNGKKQMMSQNSEETQLDLTRIKREALSRILQEEQERASSPNVLCLSKPEKWLEAASMFISGASIHEVRQAMGLHHDIAKRINGVVKTSDEAALFRRERAIQLTNTIEDISSIGEKIAESFLDGSDNAKAKIAAAETKDLTNLALAQEKLHRTFDNVTGNNVQRIEVKHITTPEEAMSLIDSLPEADVIDVTDGKEE